MLNIIKKVWTRRSITIMKTAATKTVYAMLIVLFSSHTFSLVLDNNSNMKAFQGKTIALYVGSFDMLHNGHVDVANMISKLGGIDYVLIYPAPQKGKFKNRISATVRQNMLKAVFANHPKVIVMPLRPVEIQKKFKDLNTKFVAVGGEDGLHRFFDQDIVSKKFRGFYFKGKNLNAGKWKEKQGHAIAALAMFKAEQLILTERTGESIDKYNIKVGDVLNGLKITKILRSKEFHMVSSTKIKQLIKDKKFKEAQKYLHPAVWNIIISEGLYH